MNNQLELRQQTTSNYLDYSTILQRNSIKHEIAAILQSFDVKYKNLQYKKGIYIYGSPGSGKSHFTVQLLKDIGYDVIKYDAGDVRNKALIDNITSNNISNKNVLDMMSGKTKKIAIVMDEIDGMNNGDKGGINALIKLIRQKKNAKAKIRKYDIKSYYLYWKLLYGQKNTRINESL
jgi:Cdc6-like AAA superfamily ATPase